MSRRRSKLTVAEALAIVEDSRRAFDRRQAEEEGRAQRALDHLQEYGCNSYHAYEEGGSCEWQARCDEPGCMRAVTCGTPTDAGYRSTCSAHRPDRSVDGSGLTDQRGHSMMADHAEDEEERPTRKTGGSTTV